jgi:hypothetical protein
VNRTLLCLLLVSGCAKGAVEDQTETPPPVAPQEAVYAAQPDEPREDAVLASLSEEAAAYFADCGHRFQVAEPESDAMIDECSYLDFDQNCSPDPSGCWDKGQSCQSGCANACESCDSKCDGGCNGCKSKCKAGDSECVAECAEARVECRDQCMATKEACVDTTCPEAEKACYDDHEALVAKTCPKCEQIKRCVNDAIEHDKDPLDVCGAKFKRVSEQCFEWCSELS